MYLCFMENDWFATWFDTPYYHTLYKNRNESEAKRFIENLVEYLKLPEGSKLLDLACGKGRHAITLHNKGFNVLGVDLSENSIKAAATHATSGLEFGIHDMRQVIPNKSFQAVFNLFTSFGYFDSTQDNERVLSSVHEMLVPNGILVIDFMNACKDIQNLIPKEVKQVDGILFNIERSYDQQFITKDIRFEDNGEKHYYSERVQALDLDNFRSLMQKTNFEILRTFGNFDLDSFDPKISDRLIIIAQKR